MTDAERMGDLKLALAAAIEAGRAVMRSFGQDMQVTHKSPEQPLTAADLEADRILHQRLLDARPAYGWLSEETADHPERLRRDRVWIVDPIDGTRSFIAGRREFGVSVGLAEKGRAVLGVILNPATGELYACWRGGGAWKLEDALAGDPAAPTPSLPPSPPWRRLAVRPPRAAPVILASRSEIRDGEFEPFAGFELLPLGSTTYKLARLAEGAGDLFLSRGPKSEWDLCAGGLLVREAGGAATDLLGAPLVYNRPDPRIPGILAAAPALHAEIRRRLAGLPPVARLARQADDPLHPGLGEQED